MTTHTAEDFRARTYDVLVSYQRADDDQRQELVEALEARGYSVFWDGKLGPDYWRVEWRNRLDQSKLMLVLWSVTAAQSDEVKDEAGGAKHVKKCLSVPLDGVNHLPKPYLETNRHHWDRNADEATRAAQLEKILDKVAQIIGPPSDPGPLQVPNSVAVELGTIPGAPTRLIGRDSELALLRDAWVSGPPKKVNAVVLHALGGAGKSALLRTFANELLAAGGGGATRIYGWSAYSQGSGEQKRADADGFISKALGDFCWPDALPGDPVERGRALATLVQKERVLLLLDGLEPLQDPPSLNKGRFKDKGLAELIKHLANVNAGLVVLTTRQEVPELEGRGSLVINHALDQLSDRAGADLLVELGVRGRQRELEAAVREVQGHALSVTLLGSYLAEVCGGDIRHRDQFDFKEIVLSQAEQSELVTDKTIIPAKRAAKVMRGYLKQFEKLAKADATAGLGGPERALLHLLGLFDRPADGLAMDALLTQHIPGLTDELFFGRIHKSKWMGIRKWTEPRELSSGERNARLREAKNRLRKLQLLSKPNPLDPHELDAHPLVRAFFAGRLEETAQEAAKAAHDTLYRHYAAVAPYLPNTLTDMQPLFHAVRHGVRADHVQEACDDVLWRRMRRGKDLYISRDLGAFGAQLVMCAHFFDRPWDKPHPSLSADSVPWLLGDVAFALRAVGRLREAIIPGRAALALHVARGEWAKAATDGGILSSTLLTLGEVLEAVTVAKLSVEHADHDTSFKGDNPRALRRGTLATALLTAGDLTRALELFDEAETIRERELPSLPGYHYGDLLLARGETEDARRRGHTQLSLSQRERGFGLHDIALATLLIGRAEDAQNRSGASAMFDDAVDGLRQSGRDDHLPKALLARAAHRRPRAAAGQTDLIKAVRDDLSEVEDIAGEEMRLYLTDLALERARLALDVPSTFAGPEAARAEAQAQTAKAAQLIADTGYHRRDHELAELKARFAAA